MTGAVFIQPVGYSRYCRLLTIGNERHATACLARIAAYEPAILTARYPTDDKLCSACREDMRIRIARGEDLTPWHREIGTRADLTTERAAEELFGPAPSVSRTVTPDLRGPVRLDVEALGGEEWEER